MERLPADARGPQQFGPIGGLLSDSIRLVSMSPDRTVKILDASSGACLRMLEGHSSSVLSVAFSPDSPGARRRRETVQSRSGMQAAAPAYRYLRLASLSLTYHSILLAHIFILEPVPLLLVLYHLHT